MPVFVPPLSLQKKFSALAQRHEHLFATHVEALRQADPFSKLFCVRPSALYKRTLRDRQLRLLYPTLVQKIARPMETARMLSKAVSGVRYCLRQLR
jgi:hypothetical protein